MARRSGRQPANPANNPDSLGVGALSEGRLAHGERGMVESLASSAPQQGAPAPAPPSDGGGRAPQGGGARGADVDLWSPSGRPEQPITAGVNRGPGQGSMVLADDPDSWLRVAFEKFAHPDIARMMEAREF